ncbi:unnamed protein product [Lampetra fluviatilis]
MSRPPPRVALATALAVAVATALLFLHLQLRLHGNASALGTGGATATTDDADDPTDDYEARETVADFARVARSLGVHPTLIDPRVLAALAEADDPKRRTTEMMDDRGGPLCVARDSTSFALLESSWAGARGPLLAAFRGRLSWRCVVARGVDPRVDDPAAASPPNVDLHVLLQPPPRRRPRSRPSPASTNSSCRSTRRHLVHIVILYARGYSATFTDSTTSTTSSTTPSSTRSSSTRLLWFGALRARGLAERRSLRRLDADLARLSYGRHPGAFPSYLLYSTSTSSTSSSTPAPLLLSGVPLALPAAPPARFVREAAASRFLECDRDAARRYRREFPDGDGRDGSRDGSRQFRRGARTALLEAGAALASVGAPHWVSSGTCLGWLRQCDVIAASGDVDIGVWAADFSPALLAALLGRGFRLRHKFGLVQDGLELSLVGPAPPGGGGGGAGGGVKLDVFFFYEEADDEGGGGGVGGRRGPVWNGGTQSRTGLRFEFSFGRFSLCRALLLGVPVSVPCPPRPYVEANYGPGWRRPPTRPWDWKRSAFNVRPAGAWSPRDAQRAVQTFL